MIKILIFGLMVFVVLMVWAACIVADRQKWWDDLSYRKKLIVMSLPNFDADIFYECTGIRV